MTADGPVLHLFPTGNPDNGVVDIQYDSRRQTLWACDGDTILFRKEGVWSQITPQEGLPGSPCLAIAITSARDL